MKIRIVFLNSMTLLPRCVVKKVKPTHRLHKPLYQKLIVKFIEISYFCDTSNILLLKSFKPEHNENIFDNISNQYVRIHQLIWAKPSSN